MEQSSGHEQTSRDASGRGSWRASRPQFRRVLYVIGAIALMAIGVGAWAFWETWKVYTGEPQPTGAPLHAFRAYSERVAGVEPGAGREAWALLEEIFAESERLHAAYEEELNREINDRFAQQRSVEYDRVRDAVTVSNASAVEQEMIRRLREAGVFDDLAQFVEMGPAFLPIDVTESALIPAMPELNKARQLVQSRVASMRLAFESRDWENVEQAFEQSLAVGRSIVHRPGMITMLVGNALHHLALEEVRHELMEGEMPLSVCEALRAGLERHRLPDWEYILRSERAILLDFLERISVTVDGRQYLSPRGLGDVIDDTLNVKNLSSGMLDAFRYRFLLATPDELTSLLEAWFDLKMAHIVAVNESERAEAASRIVEFEASLTSRHVLLKHLLPAMDKAIHQHVMYTMQFEATQLMLRLEAYRDVHGACPESLAALESSLNEPLPRDPVSRASFGYRLLEDDPHGRPYLLYSFGLDGVDDAGATPEDPSDTWAAITSEERGAGYDFVVNRPRPGLPD